MKINDNILPILKRCRCSGNLVYLPDQLERKDYEAVNKVLTCLGGKWNRGSKAHVFPEDIEDTFADTINAGEVTDRKKEFQLFPTPPTLANRMARILDPQAGERILEPSAGTGSLLSAVYSLTFTPIEACELMPENLKQLNKLPACKIIGEDFLDLPLTEQFDAIIANPPFSKGQDIAHVLKMWEHLKPGGRLVTITAPGWTFRDDSRHTKFRNWLASVDADTEELPPGTFQESGTMVRAMLLTIHKKASHPPNKPRLQTPAPKTTPPQRGFSLPMNQLKSGINPAILQPMLDSAANALEKGQSQFFTPLELGRKLAEALPEHRPLITDLNCGAGHLLQACANRSTKHRFGCDIDPCAHSELRVDRITSDVTALYPLLKEVGFTSTLWPLNPPWRLWFYRTHLQELTQSKLTAVRQAFNVVEAEAPENTIDSTIATLLMALDLSEESGEGFLIGNHATLQRLLFDPGAPYRALAQHVWAYLILPGNRMTGDQNCKWQTDQQFYTGVLYFARDHTSGPRQRLTPEGGRVQTPDRRYREGVYLLHYATPEKTDELWHAARHQSELLRSDRPQWNLWLAGSVIQTHLSLFEESSRTLNKNEAKRLHALNGKTPMQLVLQRNDRDELLHVAEQAGWKVQPQLLEAVHQAIHAYHAARAPLYPLPEIQRLGYLDELDLIDCKATLRRDNKIIFKAGSTYALKTRTINITRTEDKFNSFGEPLTYEYTGQELAISLTSGEKDYIFMSGTLRDKSIETDLDKGCQIDFTLEELCAHFTIPEVPDVAQVHPALYLQLLEAVNQLEKITGLSFKKFQKEDLARAALHDGLILSWDTGLGKTWSLYLWSLLKVGFNYDGLLQPNAPVLILAPGGLHDQIVHDEGRDNFGVHVTPIDSQETFLQLCRRKDSALLNLSADGRPILPPGFYITSYTQLAQNGVAAMPKIEKWKDAIALLDFLCLKLGNADVPNSIPEYAGDYPTTVVGFFEYRADKKLWGPYYQAFELDPKYSDQKELEKVYKKLMADAATWKDPDARANREGELFQTYSILKLLIPVRYRSVNIGTRFNDLAPHQQDFVIRRFLQEKLREYGIHNGEHIDIPIGDILPGFIPGRPETDQRPKWKIKCLYSPSLADLSHNAFDAIVIDEGVKIKGETTIVGEGVRSMDPLYAMIATATPIKNRLGDIFYLAAYATGYEMEAHARWPYRNDPASLVEFKSTFLVSEQKFEGSKVRSRKTPTAEVCNIHRIWKLFGSIILRRRKQDCEEEIVKRQEFIVRCKMGTEQKRAYQYHLQASYVDGRGNKAIGPQLAALRAVAADPTSLNLKEKPGNTTIACSCTKKKAGTEFEFNLSGGHKRCPQCSGSGQLPLPYRSSTDYTPKIVSVLTLVKDILERKEQVLIGSAFLGPNDTVAKFLKQAGIRHLKLDGRVKEDKRGPLASQFKRGRFASTAEDSSFPVLLAGVESMSDGYSFFRCNNVILFCYSHAWDKFKQFFDRVHRLNSLKDINVYLVICDGTIENRIENLNSEKGDSQELVLDGKLMGQAAEDVNLAELLRIAKEDFNQEEETIDEALLQADWPALRQSLSQAAAAWDIDAPPAPPQKTAGTAVIAQKRKPLQTSAPVCHPLRLDRGEGRGEVSLPLPEAPTLNLPVTPEPSLPSSWRHRLKERAARFNQLTHHV